MVCYHVDFGTNEEFQSVLPNFFIKDWKMNVFPKIKIRDYYVDKVKSSTSVFTVKDKRYTSKDTVEGALLS